MEMLSAFTAVIHVPNLNRAEHLLAVIEESEIFAKEHIGKLMKQLSGHAKYVL